MDKNMKLNVNTKIKVHETHPLYAGRVGYFQSFGQGLIAGCLVLSSKPLKPKEAGKLFSVEKEFCVLI